MTNSYYYSLFSLFNDMGYYILSVLLCNIDSTSFSIIVVPALMQKPLMCHAQYLLLLRSLSFKPVELDIGLHIIMML
jgi:hypothetical protein